MNADQFETAVEAATRYHLAYLAHIHLSKLGWLNSTNPIEQHIERIMFDRHNEAIADDEAIRDLTPQDLSRVHTEAKSRMRKNGFNI